jgi:hypothetical protein
VAILTTGGYLVKQLSPEGKVIYTPMAKRALSDLLDTLTINVQLGPKMKEIPLALLLNISRVCMRFDKFRAVDFFSRDPMVFNLWRGFHYDPAVEVDMDQIQPFLDHIRKVICADDDNSYQHELKKLGWIYQNPNDHLGFATVLLGDEGTGKGTYTDVLCDLWGPEWSEPNITNMEMITETNHAECIAFKKVIVANEIKELEHNHASWDVMKSRITDDHYRVRVIYQATKIVRNVNNYFFCTNNYLSIKMGQRDRRYDIKEVSPIHQQDTDYFSGLRETLTPWMKSHLLRFFLDIDTEGFNPEIPPCSEMKREMQEAQKPLAQDFIAEFDWTDSTGCDRREEGMTAQTMYIDGFIPWCDRYGVPERYRIKMSAFGMAIRPYVDQTEAERYGRTQRIYFPRGPPLKKIAAEPASLAAILPQQDFATPAEDSDSDEHMAALKSCIESKIINYD